MMSLPRTVADVINQHVTLELESLDRVYLNVYQPKLQTPRAMYYFLREFYGQGAVSSQKMKRSRSGLSRTLATTPSITTCR